MKHYHFTDKDIVHGLLHNDPRVINHIYQTIGPKVKAFIKQNGGSEEEAHDIFQDGIVAVFVNIKKGSYTLETTTKFSTYLFQVCKYKWYDIVKSARKTKNILIELDYSSEENIHSSIELEEKNSALHNVIRQLSAQCVEILMRFYWQNENIDVIAGALDMEPNSVKNGKYRCMKKLKEHALQLKVLQS